MARILSIAFLATIVVAALFQSSAAQTTHTVGDASGWIIPTTTPTLYSDWAANQTFAAGDVLVFNFANNQHDVTKVNKADYDACTTTNAITRVTTSPASIPINGTGAHYFICGFAGHCAAGQKLAINVSAATVAPAPQPPSSSSPAPQPAAVPAPAPQAATPTPVSAPTPASSSPNSAPTPSGIPSAPSPTTPSPAGSTTPSPAGSTTPSPAGSTTPPPSDSSARSLGVAGLSATYLYAVAVLLF